MSADLPSVDLTAASAFVASIKFAVTEATGTRVTGTVDLGPDQHTPWGVVHGGVYCSVVESAASIGASAAVVDLGQFAVGVNNNTDFVRPMTTGVLDVVAEPKVLDLGARRLPGGGGDFRVYADPVGHPFCLVWDA